MSTQGLTLAQQERHYIQQRMRTLFDMVCGDVVGAVVIVLVLILVVVVVVVLVCPGVMLLYVG